MSVEPIAVRVAGRQDQPPSASEVTSCGVGARSSTARYQRDDGGASPTTSLQPTPQELELRIVPPAIAANVIVRNHYLHSMAAGLRLCFGIFAGDRILGAIVLNAGPVGAPRLVAGATSQDCLTLARLWLDDALPRNSESRVLGLLVRVLRRFTAVKFLLSYADPAVVRAGVPHLGFVYQAANWTYVGLAENQPLMDLGDGIPRHLRSLGSTFGTHSAAYFRRHGLPVRFIPLQAKHRYVIFIDRSWRDRLRVPVLPYPKKGVMPDGSR